MNKKINEHSFRIKIIPIFAVETFLINLKQNKHVEDKK